MQSQLIAILTTANGQTTVVENIFESRYECVKELRRLGADVRVEGNTAYINGVERLKGTILEAKELRGGAALVLAGLKAEGTTIVNNITYIERGYEDICGNLLSLGAEIWIREEKRT